jgi:hypothetical protein
MLVNRYVNENGREDVAQETRERHERRETEALAGRSGTDLVIEALDEFAPASTCRVIGTCLCATNADYVYGAAARN